LHAFSLAHHRFVVVTIGVIIWHIWSGVDGQILFLLAVVVMLACIFVNAIIQASILSKQFSRDSESGDFFDLDDSTRRLAGLLFAPCIIVSGFIFFLAAML